VKIISEMVKLSQRQIKSPMGKVKSPSFAGDLSSVMLDFISGLEKLALIISYIKEDLRKKYCFYSLCSQQITRV